jgi:hypothetical protein
VDASTVRGAQRGSPSEHQGPPTATATGGPSNANTPHPRRAQSPNKRGIGSPAESRPSPRRAYHGAARPTPFCNGPSVAGWSPPPTGHPSLRAARAHTVAGNAAARCNTFDLLLVM